MLGRNWEAPDSGWSSPPALWSGRDGVAPQHQMTPHLQVFEVCVRQLLGSVEDLEEQMEESLRRQRHWADPSEEGARSPAVGLGTWESAAPGLHSLWGRRQAR